MSDSVFPLPLTALERYLLVDDRPDYPMVILIQFDMTGEVDRTGVEAALTATLAEQPLLRSRVDAGRRWCTPEPISLTDCLEWIDDPAAARAAPPEMDLYRAPGFHMSIRPGDGRSTVVAHFHHAAIDGGGVAAFVYDFLFAYARWVRDADPTLGVRKRDWGLLATSDQIAPPKVRKPSDQPVSGPPPLREVVSFLLRKPSVLKPPRALAPLKPAPVVETIQRGLRWVNLEARLSRKLFGAPRRRGATSNDALLTALFRAMAQWSHPDAPWSGKEWMRVLVPKNLRVAGDGDMPGANKMGYLFVDRQATHCAEIEPLLEGVTAEMVALHGLGIAGNFQEGVGLVDRVPGLLWALTRRRTPFATVVLSNIGQIRVPSGSRHDSPDDSVPKLERTVCSAPLRPGTRASFLVSGLGRSVAITMRTDPAHIPETAADSLLQLFVDEIEKVVGSADPSEV